MLRMKTFSITALLALLFVLFSSSTYCQLSPPEEILKWEADIIVFDSLNLMETSDASTLLVAGSSSVRLWDSIHYDLAPYRVMQRGYGGARLTDFNYYAGRIIKPQQFKAILVFVANDIAGVESDLHPKEVFRLFRDLVKQLRKSNPDTPVCWIEVTPTPKRREVIDRIREASKDIEDYCDRSEDLHFIATYDQFTTADGLPDSTLFRADMLHLNRKGYQVWAHTIKASLVDAGINP